MILDPSFYVRSEVVQIARELLGKIVCTRIAGKITTGRIVETEAYSHKERGCHAFQNRMTDRNRVMFREGGHAYVYLCYGIHNLFNIVTNTEGIADAVLIRALAPVEGGQRMMKRMKTKSLRRITSGPGKLTKAMGIDRSFNGKYLGGDKVWVEDRGKLINKTEIAATRRIGIEFAKEDSEDRKSVV